MELRSLRYFVKIVEMGSFAKAARHVHISQPALSIAIRKLELELNAPLLDRTAAGVMPTAFGKSLYENASRAIRDLNRARDALEYLRDPNNGRLTICVGPTVPGEFLMHVVLEILSEYPKFQFRLQEGTYSRHYQTLVAGEADVIISQLPAVRGDPLVTHEVVLDGEYALVARSQHPLARRRSVKPADLLQFPWLLDARMGTVVPDWVDRFRRHGLEPPRAVIDMSSPMLAKMALLKGDYLTMLPLGFIAAELRAKSIVPLAIRGFSWPQEIGASYRSERTITPALDLFLQRSRAAGCAFHHAKASAVR